MGRPARLVRWLGLVDAVERVLALAERALVERAGAALAPADLERWHALRWEAPRDRAGRGRLVPIEHPARFDLSDLVGVDRALARLVQNTEQFLRGLPCNHVLLYGERGTGKSSAVRGLLDRYAGRGLRIVEVHKQDLLHLPDLLAALRAAAGEGGERLRFLVFCDDLSFDAGEAGYRELKAALEGSLEAPPPNVRIVATSNRRHLLPETRREQEAVHLDEDGELHLGEALDEKLALSDRFGLVLGFYGFDQRTYLSIVEHYVKKAGLELAPGQLREDALRWALARSSRSGRTARQFVDDLAGRAGLRS
jgi:predicted AAA+ superfamily ATPase